MSDIADFGALISALGGGGDRGNAFPESDADELRGGARFIPGEVTTARRAGEKVRFVKNCSPCCWYWEFQNGTRVYHWDRPSYEQIGRTNHGDDFTEGQAGPCPSCGNEYTNGDIVEPKTT